MRRDPYCKAMSFIFSSDFSCAIIAKHLYATSMPLVDLPIPGEPYVDPLTAHCYFTSRVTSLTADR